MSAFGSNKWLIICLKSLLIMWGVYLLEKKRQTDKIYGATSRSARAHEGPFVKYGLVILIVDSVLIQNLFRLVFYLYENTFFFAKFVPRMITRSSYSSSVEDVWINLIIFSFKFPLDIRRFIYRIAISPVIAKRELHPIEFLRWHFSFIPLIFNF